MNTIKIISIIIPMYNCENTIIRTIDSINNNILSLKNKDEVEVILVDDGSTDNTYNIAKEKIDNNHLIDNYNLYRKNNGGPSSARHYGSLKTNAKYLWFIDAGDMICDDSLITVLGMINDKNPDIIVFNYIEKNKEKYMISKQYLKDNDLNKSLLINTIVPGMCMKIFKRNMSVINRFEELYDIWFGEDLCFSIMSSLNSNSVIFLEEPLFIYMRDESSITMSPCSEKDITTLHSIKLIKKLLIENDKYNLYKDEFECMCFNRIVLNSLLLSSNKKYYNEFLNYYKAEKINKNNKYIKMRMWLYYITLFKIKLPFQNHVTKAVKALV